MFNNLKQLSNMMLESTLEPVQKIWFKRYVAIAEMQMSVLKGEDIDVSEFIKEHPYLHPDALKEVEEQMAAMNDNVSSTGE